MRFAQKPRKWCITAERQPFTGHFVADRRIPAIFDSMSDTLTLVLDGKVTLDDFAEAVVQFHALVLGLSREVSVGRAIEWEVVDLASSSAIATAKGRGAPEQELDKVVRAYEVVGESLSRFQPPPFSPRVAEPARRLAKLVDGKIETIRFETERKDSVVRKMPEGAGAAVVATGSADAYGAVEGMVETLSRRGGLRFTLYDTVYDKAVSCYLAAGFEPIMRDVWGTRSVVSGKVHRDSLTGRPLSIRQVTKVEPVKQGKRGEWKQARGAAPLPEGISGAEAVRAGRDG